ncbi:MAG: carcinine hydrolase/isopenicillin-N N-acyltransferase family protein, partial [bacterium]
RPGVGYLSVLHRMIRAGSAAEAAAVAEGAPRAGAHTYWAADAGLQVEVEAAPGFSVRRDAGVFGICRTNHCLDPRLVAVQGEPPHVSSAARFRRVTGWLRAEGPHSVASVQAIFSDRRDGLDSVNRYPEDGDYASTNAVFVAVPAQRRAWACRGPADRGRWVALGFESK